MESKPVKADWWKPRKYSFGKKDFRKTSITTGCGYRLLWIHFSKRRVWLFAHNPLGARTSANLFSMVSSARANGLEPYRYLNYVFENLPAANTIEALEALLPWNARAELQPQRPD